MVDTKTYPPPAGRTVPRRATPATATALGPLDLRLSSLDRALLACARVRLDARASETLEHALQRGIAWGQFVEKARWHKLEGLVYHHLRAAPFAAHVPPEALAELKGLYLRNVARRLHYRGELHDLIEALHTQDIPVAVMKGGALAEFIYLDPGTRPMADLDLLVPPDRAANAWSALRSLGYRQTVDEEERRRMIEVDRQLPLLVHPTKAIVVEIHTHLVEISSPMRFDIAAFWEAIEETDIAETRALVFLPEYQLASLCLNFFKDRLLFSYSALGQLCDVAEVARACQHRLDWDLFSTVEPLRNLVGAVFCGLYLASHLLDAPVPDAVLARLAPAGFTTDDARRLVTKRVLGNDWAAKEIVPSNQTYGAIRLIRGVLSRVFEPRASIAERYGVPPDSKRLYLLYLRRIAEAFRVGASMARRPGSARDDFATDRWLHSLQRLGESPGSPEDDTHRLSRGQG